MSYIKVKEVLSLFNDLVNDCADKDEFYNRAFDAVDTMPIADVVEVRHGEWKYPPYAPFGGSYEMKRCTVCGYKPDFDADNPYTKFCPECGAKMDGERSTDNE